MAECILCNNEVSWWNIVYNKYCPSCWKNKQDEIKKIDEKKDNKVEQERKREEIEEHRYKNNPELKRLEQLKSSRVINFLLLLLSISLTIGSIFGGMVGERFFLISFDFILWFIVFIIMAVRSYNIGEKIKDLEMVLAQKNLRKKNKIK